MNEKFSIVIFRIILVGVFFLTYVLDSSLVYAEFNVPSSQTSSGVNSGNLGGNIGGFSGNFQSGTPGAPMMPPGNPFMYPFMPTGSFSVGNLKMIQIHVTGEVLIPGTYYLTVPVRLTTALSVTGGITKRGSKRDIVIYRKGVRPIHIDLYRFEREGRISSDPYLLDNDVILVPFKKRVVKVIGSVRKPGEHELLSEKSLSDVIKLAGGFTSGVAKYKSVEVVRFISDTGEKEVIKVPFDENSIKSFNIKNGDIIIIPHIFTAKNKLEGVSTIPGDNFNLDTYENRVFVVGGVRRPGAYPFNPHYRLSQYYALAGGGTRLSKRDVKVISADGTIKKTTLSDDSVIINPGDTIEVEQKLVSTEFWISFMGTIASIGLSAVAIFK